MRIRDGVAALVILGAACSSGTASSTPTTTSAPNLTTTTALVPKVLSPRLRLELTVGTYTGAFGTGDAQRAWALVSKRCQGAISETDYRANIAAAAVKYPGLRMTKFDSEIDGSAATVTYETSSPEITERDQRWVFERGDWRYDGC